MQKYLLNNIKISVLSIEELIFHLEKYLNTESSNEIITTFNLDFLRISEYDEQFREICKNSILNLPDGIGITSLLKLKYKVHVKRITGNDIFPIILYLAKKLNLKVAIVGGSELTSKKVNEKIINEINISKDNLLCLSPEQNFEFNKEKNNKVVTMVTEFKPDIVFAALGCPRQEKWLHKYISNFGSKLNVGIGATLDFYSGEKKRSPEIIQRIGLEWLWRLFQEPKRLFSRYVINDIPFYSKYTLEIILHKK